MKVATFMTPREKLIVGDKDITLKRANDVIWDNKLNALPVVDENDCLVGIVFRKDYDSHKSNPNEMLDANKRYMVGAGHQHARLRRARAEAHRGRALTCSASTPPRASASGRSSRSIGSASITATTSRWAPATSSTPTASVIIADCGADFVKVGIGGGLHLHHARDEGHRPRPSDRGSSMCARARDEYFEETGVYVPVCSDGGIVYDYHMTLALAMGCRLHDARTLLRALRREPDGAS